MVRLEQKYREHIIPKLREQFAYGNVLQVPRVEKITLNMGLGEAVLNPKVIDSAVDDLARITGQKPVIRRARKSIANFKLRAGMPIGVSVTLRRAKMYEFLDRLINVALPRVRDFKGISNKAFDGRGNYTMGITEQLIFPEVDIDTIAKVSGMNITIVTTAKTDEEGRALLAGMGMPFRK